MMLASSHVSKQQRNVYKVYIKLLAYLKAAVSSTMPISWEDTIYLWCSLSRV